MRTQTDNYPQNTITISIYKGLQTRSTSIHTTAFGMAGGSIWDEELKKFAAYKDLSKHLNPTTRHRWTTSGVNEFGRLFQGFNDIEGMDVLNWIWYNEIPLHKTVTYPQYTVDIRPEKAEPYRTHITAGGNLLEYLGNVTTHTASMETIKCHWNSVLSTKEAKYCTGDISNMYLCSWLKDY